MGFWGSYLVVNTAGDGEDLAELAARTEGVTWEEDRGLGWGIFAVDDSALVDDPTSTQAIAVETGHPALTAFVLDSDTARVEGWSSTNGSFTAQLAPEAMRAFLADEPSELGPQLEPHDAAIASAQWAVAAALSPNREQILTVPDADPFVEVLLWEYLDALGVPPGDDG